MKVWKNYWIFHLPIFLQSLIVFPIEVKVLTLTCKPGESGPGSLEAFLTPLFASCSKFTSLLFKYSLNCLLLNSSTSASLGEASFPSWVCFLILRLLLFSFSQISTQWEIFLPTCHIISLPCSKLSISQHTQNLNSLLWPMSPI